MFKIASDFNINTYLCTKWTKMTEEIVIPKTISESIELYNSLFREEGGMVLISICDKGQYSLMIDNKKYFISIGDILICPPGLILSTPKIESGDKETIDVKYVGVKYSAFLNSIRTGRNIWSILMYARSNPVFHLDGDDRELTSNYYKVLAGKLKTKRSFYYDEILHTLLQCIIYELCVILNRDLGEIDTRSEKRKDKIFKKFVEKMSENEGQERSLKYYADILGVTPKYLSAVTNEICGISAHELILNNVAVHIRQQLEFSSKSIKELSAQYGFPNLSSFGKFVKTRLGNSPRAIRISGKKTKQL